MQRLAYALSLPYRQPLEALHHSALWRVCVSGSSSAGAFEMSVRARRGKMGRILTGCRTVFAAVEGLGKGTRRRPIVLADIGGRGGLPRAWDLLWRAGILTPVFFEPDPQAAAEDTPQHRSLRQPCGVQQAAHLSESRLNRVARPCFRQALISEFRSPSAKCWWRRLN